MLLIACQTQMYCTPAQKARLFRRERAAPAFRSPALVRKLIVEVDPAMKFNMLRAAAAVCLSAFALAPTSAWSQCCDVVPACQTVFVPQPVTAFRLEYETVMKPVEVTSYRPVWETSTQERRFMVAKPVTETSYREERFTVLRPVMTTEERQQVTNVVHYETSTQMQENRQIVQRPVWVQQVRREQFTVQRPVTRTVMQNQQTTEMQQVTTFRVETVDQGNFVDQQTCVQNRGRNRLQWLPGHNVADPATGTARWQRGGLFWVPTPGASQVVTNRVWVPNVVQRQVPVTQMVPQVVNRQVPIQVTEMVNEVQTRDIPFQVCQMQQEEQVTQVPITVCRPVTRQVVNKFQVQVCNWQSQEMVQRVPVTTCKVQYEERVEQIPVKTCKWVAETSTVMQPETVAKWVQVTYTRMVPKTVMLASPAPTCCGSELATTSFYAPTQTVIVQPVQPAPTTSPAPQTQAEPTPADQTPSLLNKTTEGDATQPEPDLNPPSNDEGTQPADRKPTLPPAPYNGPLRPDDNEA